MEVILQRDGTRHETSTPYSSYMIGKVEQQHLSHTEMIKALLHTAGMHLRYWSLAAGAATHILNRVPCHALQGKIPYEMWTGNPPDLSHIYEVIWVSSI
jgi:hypothetical protein